MFDVLLGVIGLKSFQKSYPASQNMTAEKYMFVFGKEMFLLQDRCSALVLVGVWNLGIWLKLAAVAHLAKLTKITFDLLQIQWNFALSFWKKCSLKRIY